MSLQFLVAEAVALGGGNLCASGHDWKAEGSRSCYCTSTTGDGMPVFRCTRCGEYDYGQEGGPGDEHCTRCNAELNRYAEPCNQQRGSI